MPWGGRSGSRTPRAKAGISATGSPSWSAPTGSGSASCTAPVARERTRSALLEALELIRGRPFGDLDAGPGYEWLHIEGHIHHMGAEIADAAELAAELLLAAGDPIRARRAVDKGLLAAPYAERLWVQLMAVADALGEAQEVERILADMDRRLGLDGDFDQLHPDTVAAYRRYSRARNQRRAL